MGKVGRRIIEGVGVLCLVVGVFFFGIGVSNFYKNPNNFSHKAETERERYFEYSIHNGVARVPIVSITSLDAIIDMALVDTFIKAGVHTVEFEIMSGGGGAFQSIAICQLMDDLKAEGIIVETKVYGLAASGAALIMSNGTPGHRGIGKYSLIMIHYAYIDLPSYASEEDKKEAKKICDIINEQLVLILDKNTIVKKETLLRALEEETWFGAEKAIRWGFADYVME